MLNLNLNVGLRFNDGVPFAISCSIDQRQATPHSLEYIVERFLCHFFVWLALLGNLCFHELCLTTFCLDEWRHATLAIQNVVVALATSTIAAGFPYTDGFLDFLPLQVVQDFRILLATRREHSDERGMLASGLALQQFVPGMRRSSLFLMNWQSAPTCLVGTNDSRCQFHDEPMSDSES